MEEKKLSKKQEKQIERGRNNSSSKTSSSPMNRLLEEELQKGKEIARDPQNAFLPHGALRVTNHNSKWLNDTCHFCNFKFRKEDRVRICPSCDFVLHEDETFELNCWSNFFKEKNKCPKCDHEIPAATPTGAIDEAAKVNGSATAQLEQNIYIQFSEGIKEQWTMFGEDSGWIEPDILKSKDDPRYGKKCLVCGEGIRLGDRFVQCPKSWNNRDWGCCFHADVLRHRTCWTERFNMQTNKEEGKEETGHCLQSGGVCTPSRKKTN